jgi:hypothetical protein
MGDLINVTEYQGHKINVYQDCEAESPDTWNDEELFLIYDHRQFSIFRKGFDPKAVFESMKMGKKLYKGFYVFRVYAYIHSGVALSLGNNTYPFTDRFDVSFSGFALVKRSEGSYTQEQASKEAEGLVKTWNQYLSGDVYGYAVEDLNGKKVDSCWGFYGAPETSGLLDDAKAVVDCMVKDEALRQLEVMAELELTEVY